MSSSVFIESSSKNVAGTDSLDQHGQDGGATKGDSNLVVVYGKNGVSFDPRGIESMIEEKTLSSISVIRITSPTPSMLDEEEEAEKAEELLRRQKNGVSDVETDDNSNKSSGAENQEDRDEDNSSEADNSVDDKSSDSVGDSVDNGNVADTTKKTKRIQKTVRKTKSKIRDAQTKSRKERPEIVGLTVEEFYPPENAIEMVKEALKLAGVSPIKHTADYEFQLYVIKNDHCYTPFTSPEQMKAKLAEKQAAVGRKGPPQTGITMKQLQTKKKGQAPEQIEIEDRQRGQPAKELTGVKDKKDRKLTKQSDVDNFIEDDEDILSSGLELDSEDELLSEESDESDNDRDSDLDFDVNNRKGRKRKEQSKFVKRLSQSAKIQNTKRVSHGQDESTEMNTVSRTKGAKATICLEVPRTLKSSLSLTNTLQQVGQNPTTRSPAEGSPNLPSVSIPKKQSIISRDKEVNPTLRSPLASTSVRRGPIIQVGVNEKPSSSSLLSSPHAVKEIALNKVIASPRRGFTDIGSLLGQQADKPARPTHGHTSSTSMSKGFMPLGVETAAKNKLPAQISIQTHQSSSELAAKNKPIQIINQAPDMQADIHHDSNSQTPISTELASEHIDLIVSMMEDEIQKSGAVDKSRNEGGNENIPKLVKMLENTEKALECNASAVELIQAVKSQPGMQLSNFASTDNSVDIDISNAPLLEGPEGDEIPDDLLQHVDQLIKDEKTLQEEVEKQVFGDDSSEALSSGVSGGIAPTISTLNPPPLAPIFQSMQGLLDSNFQNSFTQEPQGKSIIEMTISNVPSTSSHIDTNVTTSSSQTAAMQAVKTQPLPTVRKEPIQIVRGNGRVITLPPIEAPTTRAKRRAQAQPSGSTQNLNASTSSVLLNESSLDSSLQSNSSFAAVVDANVTADKKVPDSANKRRASTATAGASKSAKKSSGAASKRSSTSKASAAKTATDAEASGSQDDDDPNKLWCICRQPHNNRFMICCDICEDWFHGTCVSVTKAMGLEMEQKGIDWTCPKCLKQQEEKKQRKITDMLLPKQVVAGGANETGVPVTDINSGAISGTDLPTIAKESNQSSASLDPSSPSLKEAIVKQGQMGVKKVQPTANTAQRNIENQKKTTSPIYTVASVQRKMPTTSQTSKVVGQPVVTGKHKSNVTHAEEHKHTSTAKPQRTPGAATYEPVTHCIMCKKVARVNSIYCSDECIRKHAQNALNAFSAKSPEPTAINAQIHSALEDSGKKKKAKGLFEDVLSMADRKPKAERVYVFERKTGRVLTGSNAPTTHNLKKWLQDNQTFEVVQPGSTQALEIEKKQKQRAFHSSSPIVVGKNTTQSSSLSSSSQQSLQSPTKTSPPPSVIPSQSGGIVHSEVLSLPKTVKQLVEHAKMSPNSPRPSTPKQLQKYPQQVSIKPDKVMRSESKEDSNRSKDKPTTKQRLSGEGVGKKHTENVTSSTDPEPIRLNVRRTLKQQLLQRINERNGNNDNSLNETSVKLTSEEVEKFVTETEAEMYNYFNRDTGSKYKAKYRSLMFNIKDRKNHTLFAKICAKLIQPKQLVRMSPEELASQELAQWRENEAKHQLEMIKKSELDMLSCAKNYVLKTHKGEEVIEGKSTDCVNLDLTIPVEDVVSVLNNAAVTSSDALDEVASGILRKDKSQVNDFDLSSSCTEMHSSVEKTGEEKGKGVIQAREKEKEREREKDRDRERERDRDRDREREHAHDREKRHKSKDHHREKSHSRKHSGSPSRSRSRSREKRHKSSHREERREKDERGKDRDERERDRGRERERGGHHRDHKDDPERKSSEKKQFLNSSASSTSKSGADSNIREKEKQRETSVGTCPKKPATPKPLETFSLIDQILESTKTVEEAANLATEKEKEKKKDKESERNKEAVKHDSSTVSSVHSGHSTPTHSHTQSANRSSSHSQMSDSDQEPTSTVSISTPPQDPYLRYYGADSPSSSSNSPSNAIWSGSINMIDVASFQIIVQPVVGNCLKFNKLLPEELDVVGRISPDTVWDYISKIKKSPNKEIVIIRLLPASESETIAYTILYQYLENRNRLGVINTESTQIKDFYIYPLGTGNKMPQVLQPLEKVDFYDDPYRPDMLVGIIVRVVGKRTLPAPSMGSSTSMPFPPKSSRKSNDPSSSFTPPGSPKRKKRPHPPNDDEIDIDAIIKAPIAAKINKSAVAELPSMEANDADEPYSPGDGSDDDTPLLAANAATSSSHIETDLKRKMDELNRQIAAQEMEIAGLLNVEPSCFAARSTTSTAVLANISIPSNLSQILASINSKAENPQTAVGNTPQAPPPPPLIGALVPSHGAHADEEYNPEMVSFDTQNKHREKSSSSRLAQLSEAELLSLVPDDMIEHTQKPSYPSTENKTHYEEPPPPGV